MGEHADANSYCNFLSIFFKRDAHFYALGTNDA